MMREIMMIRVGGVLLLWGVRKKKVGGVVEKVGRGGVGYIEED
jgi:hypothetical protein